MRFFIKNVTSLHSVRKQMIQNKISSLKRFLLLLFFSCSVVGVFAQKEFVADPTPLAATTTVTCGTLTLVISGTDPLCNGAANGSASVSVSGGTTPYSYLWSPPGGSATTASITGLVGNTYLIQVWDATIGGYCSGSIALVNPASLIVNITPPAPVSSCFGLCDGSATATPTGGTSPYTYSWNTAPIQTTTLATGLCAQLYVVTITDANGCTAVRNVNIGQPAPLVSNGTTTSITCFGLCNGTASVAPTGGNVPYTYSWSPGGATTSSISNLCPGSYTCTIRDTKICITTYITTISQPALLTVTVTGSNLLCNSVCTGSVTATASGGMGAYTYAWAPGGYTSSAVTGMCAGSYTLTLRDANNCVTTATVTLTQPSAITSIPTGNNINCFNQCDGTANANAAGGVSPYTYLWTPGGATSSSVSNLCNNTYSVTISDQNGCTKVSSITLTQPAVLAITPTKTNETCAGSCDGTATATVSGGTAPYTYLWAPGGKTTSTATGLCPNNYTITVRDSKNCLATATITVSPPIPILPNLSSTSVTCNGLSNGSATSSPTGGVSPYTYLWTPGGQTTSTATGLSAGSYSVLITGSAGCTATGTINVTQPNLFTASIGSATPNPLKCNGDCDGSILINLNGGTPTYSYAWSTGATTASITGLCAGAYSLTAADANGCTATTSVTFTAPTVLTSTLSSTNPPCFGSCTGSVTITASGGTGAYTYAWLPGGQTTSAITSQCAGFYTITVTDSKGCFVVKTVTLTQPSAVAANASVINNVSCSGACDGSATSAPTGGTPPYTYLWGGGITTQTITGLCQGAIGVMVTDSKGCSNINNLNITQPSALLSFISTSTSSCNLCTGSASIISTGGTTPYSYSWSPGGQTTSTATGLCVGVYSVTITDANNCTNSLTVNVTSKINVTLSSSGPSVSCAGSCDASATATPSGGANPYTYSWTGGQTNATATGLCAGVYSVTVTDNSGCTATKTVSFSSPTPLTNTISSTAASCGICNGTATVATSGGTGTLTYAWSGFPSQNTTTATGLCAGNYSVLITDANNCTSTNTVLVGIIPTISNNPSTTLTTCGSNNGAICASASGGVSPYTYSWAPGLETTSCITGLVAGIYTVTIADASGCTAVFPIALGSLTGPTLTVISALDPLCNAGCDGAIAVSAAGNSPFTYLWTPSGQTTSAATGLCAGTYILQVDDNVPCPTFTTVVLSNPPQLVANPTISNVSCNSGNNGSICLSPAGGNTPYTFTWSSGQSTSCISGLTAGTYSVILADASGCDDTLALTVTQPALLSVSITATNVTCNGSGNGSANATVSGGTTPYTYSWSNGSSFPTIVGLSPGNYSLTVTDQKGCTATSTVSITQPVALTTTVASSNITCNSICNGTATLSASGGSTAYSYSWLAGGQTTSTISALCVGNYFGTVTDANGCTSSQTVSITQPTAISPTLTTTNASCFGGCDGSASVNLSGGTGSYTYLWNPGGYTTSAVTGLCAGNYTLTVSDANACTSPTPFTISSQSLIQANITFTQTTCNYTCDGTATSSPLGGTGTYTFQWSNGGTSAITTGLCAGTYTLVVTDANNCSASQAITITSPPILTQSSSISAATCLVCNGSITVAGNGGTSPYSFFWGTGATTAAITGLCAGVYIDTVMDANGCISLDTNAVSNSTGPFVTVSSTSVTCFGACDGTGTIVSSTGNGPPWVYAWTFPAGSQTTQSVSGLCPNQYFAHVTDINGCTTIKSINIIGPAQLVPNAVATNATCFGICDGGITTAATGGTGAYTYSWLPGGATTSSISAQCAGNYTLTLSDANNCSLTTTISIGQNTVLTSTITSTNNSCNAACDGTASVSMIGGSSPYTYTWTGGQSTSTATGLCAGNYTISVIDAVGCTHTNTISISQPAALALNITGTNPLCNNACNGIISAAPTGGTAPYTYLWMPGGQTTTSVTGLCSGTYSLQLSDANNCLGSNTITLTNPAILTSTFVSTNASCNNTCNGLIDITPTGGTTPYSYTWVPGGQTTQDVSGLCAGIYSVTITDANACTATYSMSIGVITTVIANAGADTTFCLGGTATLTSSSVNAITLGWYQLPAWTSLGATGSISVSPFAGINNYALIATNGICSDTDTVAVIVNNYPILVVSNTTICAGTSASICAAGANGYMWYQLPAWSPISTGSCISVSPPVGTTSYGIIGFNGTCTDTDSVSVTVLPPPVSAAGNDTALCAGSSVLLCGTNSLNGATYNWYLLPTWTLTNTVICTSVSPAVSSTYALIVSNGICSDTDSVFVTVNTGPVANAGSDVTILTTGTVVLNGSGSGNYLWSPSAGLSSTTIANPAANPTTTTTYTLLVTDVNGCTSVDFVTITIVRTVKPNDGLSPNGDGINDIWEIPNIEAFPGALVEVYNRWGEVLFSTTDYPNNKWNAKYNGKELPVGTYYYVINLKSVMQPDPITGPITILR